MSISDVLTTSTHAASDGEQLGRVLRALTPDEAARPVARYYLVGGGAEDPVELPEEVYRALRHVVDAMQRGLSVTISPTSQTLTTQQAADLLGISRPTLIRALDEGRLPYSRVGTHRRIALTDVLDHREQRRREQYDALDEVSQSTEEDRSIPEVLDDLRRARKAVAAKRRHS